MSNCTGRRFTTRLTELAPAPPSLSVTVSMIVYVPARRYCLLDVMVDIEASVPVVGVPVAQSITYVQGLSRTPGSENVPVTVADCPEMICALLVVRATIGGTLRTVNVPL